LAYFQHFSFGIYVLMKAFYALLLKLHI